MGSLADQLGSLLPQDWQDQVAEVEDSVTDVSVENSGQAGPKEASLAAILDETGFQAELMHPDLRLIEDLDLTGLALWSVVAQVEHALKVTFPDTVVNGWVTLGDLLQSVDDGGVKK